MFQRHNEKIAGTELSGERLQELNKTMHMLERFWASQSSFSGI
jgi:hypothetical protein